MSHASNRSADGNGLRGDQAMSLVADINHLREPFTEPLVVPPRQACRMLSISHTRLYELLHEGQFETYRYGRSRRITTASIRAYIERQVAETGGTWEPPP